MYKVIHFFTDLQDFNHPYQPGDVYPRVGLDVTEARIDELLGTKNRQGKPLIEKVVEKQEEVGRIYTKTEINRMPLAELRELAVTTGKDDAYKLTGGELKKYLMDVFVK